MSSLAGIVDKQDESPAVPKSTERDLLAWQHS